MEEGVFVRISDNVQQVASIYTKENKVSRIETPNKVGGIRDNIKISETGKDYALVQKALKDVPDVRQDKIDAVMNKMNKGEYSVTGNDIASKLFEDSFSVM